METPQKAADPVIVRTPSTTQPRDSVASNGRTVGKGIFQFKEARQAQQPLVDTSEAPVPRPFSTNNKFLNGFDKEIRSELAFRSKEPAAPSEFHGHAWSVYCNNCDNAVTDAHFHCSICDGGDYDLCPSCVAQGHLCPGQEHWLIKRFVKDGKVVNSTTERIQPRQSKTEEPEIKKEIPGAFTEDTKTLSDVPQYTPTRTCNSCVISLPDSEFVTCTTCEDFDLCIKCISNDKHGHHPAHGFAPATADTMLTLAAEAKMAPGRNVRHNAICDNCDKKVIGIRHKCLDCPDWDYCNDCVKNAQRTHPRHRFTAIYSPIGEACTVVTRHAGIFCDGPLCGDVGQSYITGVRYKCAVCNDTDFCASCEAVPSNSHNRTHPLIKFKTPVHGVSISTENEDTNGRVRMMGDRRPAPVQAHTRTASTETTPVPQSNAATQVQTMAEIKPTEEKKTASSAQSIPATLLNARFVKDSVPDGTVFAPGTRFTQVFTMRNEGTHPWPAGCSVRHVGGDNMLNVDNSRPASVSDIREATESNVIGRNVAVGEEIAFAVTLKAPTREGKHISYWRMKSADGTPFGHRLWVDIVVKNPAQAPAAPQPIPYSNASQQQQTQIRMQQQRSMLAALQQQQQQHFKAQTGQQLPPPPAYESLQNGANISARIAAMREQQSKRREQLMAQFNANREQLQAQGINRGDMPNWNQHFNPNMGSTAESSSQPQQSEEDKARKDAARQRVEHIKAKILRAREEKVKAAEAKKRAAAEESEKVKKILEEVVKNNEAEKEAEAQRMDNLADSGMVFPKLEKESPASSTYQSVTSTAGSSKGKAAYVENEEGEVERAATPAAAAPPSVQSPTVERDEFDDDDFEEIEVLSADGEESDAEDDGFLTDEEYDILDASDHETVASP